MGLLYLTAPRTSRRNLSFVTGAWVTYKARSGRQVRGQVVGPDQDYFPSPTSVFVSFPSTGLTHLLPVADLELAESSKS